MGCQGVSFCKLIFLCGKLEWAFLTASETRSLGSSHEARGRGDSHMPILTRKATAEEICSLARHNCTIAVPYELFSGGPKWGFWVGDKFMLKKFMCLFRPLKKKTRTGIGNRNCRNLFFRNRKRNRNGQNRFPRTETGTIHPFL